MPDSVLKGKWTYRSFVNNVALVGDDPQKALSLIFGEGELRFSSSDNRSVKAVPDFGGGSAMDLSGTVIAGIGIGPQVLQIAGTGREGTPTAKWVYQYLGYAVPDWPEGTDQVPAIVGTGIRTIPHGTGPAGVVASFVALKRA